jgi:hypothetical protein
MMIHSTIKRNYSILAAVLYHFKDREGFGMQNAVQWMKDHADDAWSLPRAPQDFDTMLGHVHVTHGGNR